MPRYYMHVHNGGGFAPDEEGRELADVETAMAEAVKGARSLLSAEVLGLAFAIFLVAYGAAVTWQTYDYGDVSTTSFLQRGAVHHE